MQIRIISALKDPDNEAAIDHTDHLSQMCELLIVYPHSNVGAHRKGL